MSLTGNLEDLPLLDILQIVSFSKKTGYLAIPPHAGEGAIVFRDGLRGRGLPPGTAPDGPAARALPLEARAAWCAGASRSRWSSSSGCARASSASA